MGSIKLVSWVAACIIGLTLMAGCSPPVSMHVREGGEPINEDKDVLFRTTYFFRVFDFCEEAEGGKHQIGVDSLYRFRMTGKGIPWANSVFFESGTLKAWQIDPFGSSVEIDKQTGKTRYVSDQKQNETFQQSALYGEVARLRDLLKDMEDEKASGKNDQAIATIRQKINANLTLIGPGGTPNVVDQSKALAIEALTLTGGRIFPAEEQNKVTAETLRMTIEGARKEITQSNDTLALLVSIQHAVDAVNSLNEDNNFKLIKTQATEAKNTAKDREIIEQAQKMLAAAESQLLNSPQSVSSPTTDLTCGSGLPARRGFQIMGPEGWRTFDQDERLVLAMSSSGKPLLDTMSDLSSRIMGEKANGLSKEILLGETISITRARTKLSEVQAKDAQSFKDSLDAVKAAFDNKEGR